jgi:4-amino-4-deoxy-L-arabinose transferase-like glycosyltransferase
MVSLALVLEAALLLRIVAADLVDAYVHRGGPAQLCLFPDTLIYWHLARTIRDGAPYEVVEWGDIPHFARRTPGYPVFLAACQACFGERTLAVRLVQAVLGTISVYLVYGLTRQVLGQWGQPAASQISDSGRVIVALFATALAAIHPYFIMMSTLILSEAVFVPLSLGALWGLAALWGEGGATRGLAAWRVFVLAAGSGAAAGLAILVRPSWALFPPAALVAWVAARVHDRHALAQATGRALVFVLGIVVVMSPWWVRNARIYGRFVPTALWMGASLYDGLNPKATGASDMAFRNDREIWPLDEQDQDAMLTRRAVGFARDNPGRALWLAVVKLGRFWSPWLNAEGLRSPVVRFAGAIVELPIFALLALGIWDRRRDLRAWALLAGPLLYFCALHMVFASSMRYRIPGEMPALGLAAIGGARWCAKKRASSSKDGGLEQCASVGAC